MTLSDRIAALSAPDRAMELRIARATGANGVWECKPFAFHSEYTKSYLRSIDAALTLVPDGYQFHPIVQTDDGWTASLVGPKIVHGDGATLAIAICVVALKARGL